MLPVRIPSLAQGKSGVRPMIAERLVRMLQKRVLPCIPAAGSVCASGDLTPLSYVAATLCGEREVRVDGRTMRTAQWLKDEGLEPIQLIAKEAHALQNRPRVPFP